MKMTNDLAWLLVLVLMILVKETAGQRPPPGFKYASYEVIIPKRQTPRYGYKAPQYMNYLLKIEGKSHMVYLRQKRAFVPKHFPIFTYSKEGHLQVDYPFIRDDCFYDGFIQGVPVSMVSISTCSGGLRGVLQIENKSYDIEPVSASAVFQHVVYRLEEEEGTIHMRCGLTKEEQLRQAAMIQNTGNVASERSQDKPWWTHTMYAKVAIVVEHERYVQFGRNETAVALNILDVIQLANTWYAPLGVQLFLVGLEIWSEKNLIDVTTDMNKVLDHFTTWKRQNLNTRVPHDASHLFAYKEFRINGLAQVGTICWKEWSSAVEKYTDPSLSYFTNTFAHEHGHILGMYHDDDDDTKACKCEHKKCIMAAYHSGSDKFSNCSYLEYYNHMKSGTARCMFSALEKDKEYKLRYCGNRIVEPGEQCDCGSKPSCLNDPCCQSDCRLHSGVTCAFGECCSKCQYLPAATVCRKSTSDCDLPEYCNGSSAHCPGDVYVQDGAPCEDGAYCYHGNCSTPNKQCEMIFGKGTTVASVGCFRKLNTQGDRFGNCGFKGVTYKKCDPKNIMCGRIQCGNINKLPSLKEHNTIIQTRINNSLCWGTDYHHGTRTPDIGAVNEGTPCDKDMMCINRECTNISLLQYDCNVTKCHNRGICNSHKNCHCQHGWAPPYCVEKGYGGSIDSGPPSPPTVFAIPPGGSESWSSAGVWIPIVVTFILIFISLALYYIYRANWRH